MFPILYHAHHNRHPEDLPFWLELASRQAGPILELGCGSGRVLTPLAAAGYTVFGLDNDPDMLAFLRRTLPPELRGRVHIWQASLTQFQVARRFGLILLPCNTYSTLSSAERRSTLEAVRQHLAPGGAFAVSQPNPVLLKHLPAHSAPEVEETFQHPVDGQPVQVSSGWERSGEVFLLSWHYDHFLPDGSTERLTAQVRHFLLDPDAYLEEFKQAGLEPVHLYGEYDFSRYSRMRSSSLIILAAPAG